MYEVFVQLLQEQNITAYKVAKETGISNATLSDWKNGRSVPKADKLQKIADYFGVSIDFLMGATDKKNAPLPRGNSVSDAEIKFALFDGAENITDEMYEEVKRFAQFIKDRGHDNKGTL